MMVFSENSKPKELFKPGILRALILILIVGSINQIVAQSSLEREKAKLDLFLKSLDEKYVDTIAYPSLVEKAMRSMLEELDPHSVYMTAEQYKSASEPLKGKYKGIGIRYQIIDDTLTVSDVIPGSGASKALLKAGDQLIALGKDTLSGKKLRTRELSNIIKDEKAVNKENLIFKSGSSEQVSTLVERSQIEIRGVPTYFMLDDQTAYLKLDRFIASSFSEVKSALENLSNAKAANLIFDLRGNIGGYVTIAVKIVDEFLENRKLIVYTDGLHQPKKETFATTGGHFTKGNLVILIDENSASASEIVAGAIQDLDRRLIVGRRSYGKGLVQRTVEFDDGFAMRLTISRYYTPSGRSIQKPYDQGVALYKRDIANRKSQGELFSKDSIPFNDDYVYYTPSKRRVYGGGGIIPDLFVAADSVSNDDFYREVSSRGLHFKYTITFSEQNRASIILDYPSVDEFARNFHFDETHMETFFDWCIHRGVNDSNKNIRSGEGKT
jgi:carboxyl-terminal processing protease